jgi:hypothetical protein
MQIERPFNLIKHQDVVHSLWPHRVCHVNNSGLVQGSFWMFEYLLGHRVFATPGYINILLSEI